MDCPKFGELCVQHQDHGILPKCLFDEATDTFVVGHNQRVSFVSNSTGNVRNVEGVGPFYDFVLSENQKCFVAVFELEIIVLDAYGCVISRATSEIVSDWRLEDDKVIWKDIDGRENRLALS